MGISFGLKGDIEIMETLKSILFYIGMIILQCVSLAVFVLLLALILQWGFTELIGKDNVQTIDKATTKFINTQIKNLEDYTNAN